MSTRRVPRQSYLVRHPSKMEPVHPGELLEHILEGDEDTPPVSIRAAAMALGVSRQTIYDVMAGEKRVSPEFAIRLGAYFGNGPGLWIRMQAAWDVWHAERAPRPKVVPHSASGASRQRPTRARR